MKRWRAAVWRRVVVKRVEEIESGGGREVAADLERGGDDREGVEAGGDRDPGTDRIRGIEDAEGSGTDRDQGVPGASAGERRRRNDGRKEREERWRS